MAGSQRESGIAPNREKRNLLRSAGRWPQRIVALPRTATFSGAVDFSVGWSVLLFVDRWVGSQSLRDITELPEDLAQKNDKFSSTESSEPRPRFLHKFLPNKHV